MFIFVCLQVISSLMYLVISYILTDQIMDPQRMGLFIMLGVTVSLTAQGAGFLVGVTTPIKGSVFAMYGLNRTNLECDILYCHMKLPSKILQTLDMEDVDIWGNMEMLVGMWCLIHLTTIVAIWFRLNRR
uniref:ABC-2 type transporter domain-containing protein n=1 Tax=Timema douglasi TaxID=61478 RepID=A0A7R8VZU7_TIMDO|nr:unnamed protein product [Timema douglasi]